MRIYGDKLDINQDAVAKFYDSRAAGADEKKYTTVLLGDQDSDYARRWDEYEKHLIFPKLNVKKNSVILDLGCGIGRWADTLHDKCYAYYGVDVSPGMIETARASRKSDNCQFYYLSALDALKASDDDFDVIIMTGVAMYINDDELKKCYKRLKEIMREDTILYLEESVGKDKRLTLDKIWSDNLQSEYSAIYRTRDEYLSMVMDIGEIIEDGYMTELDTQEDTSHWYCIIKGVKNEQRDA